MSAAIGLAILALVAACLFAVGIRLLWWAFGRNEYDPDDPRDPSWWR